jgi:WD40 repeat protein/serine/threonine protein kinase
MDDHLTTPVPQDRRDSANPKSPAEQSDPGEWPKGEPSTYDASDEQAALFDAAMRRMPADYQAVIELRSVEQKSVEDLCKALNRSVEEIRSLWLEAFARLQKELGFSANDNESQRPASSADKPNDELNERASPADPPKEAVAFSDLETSLRAQPGPANDCLELIERVRRSRRSWTPRTPVGGTLLPFDDETFQKGSTPHRLGRFEVIRELGRGGHGIVYLARDAALKRQIALKIPRPDLLLSRSLRRRFVDEAQAAARLDHPNIARVFEAGFDGTFCYIVQELCDGPALATWLRERRESVEPDVAAWVAMKLAKALAHAHEHGILHRDVKPANVLLKPTSQGGGNGNAAPQPANEASPAGTRVAESFPFIPKLCDFGICKAFDEEENGTATHTDAVVGTAAYMAPEQAKGDTSETGPKTDVYGLGAILYEMLTGAPPIRGRSRLDILQRVVTDEPIPVRRIRPNVPGDLQLVCLKCLAKEPSRRYATAELLAEDLKRFLKREPVTARSVRPWERVWLWSRRHPLGASLALLAGFLFSAWVLTVMVANVRLHDLNQSLASANAQLVQAGQDKDTAAAHARELQFAAEREQAKADELLYVSDLQQAGMALRSGDTRRLMNLLERHRRRARVATYQGGELDFLLRRGQVAHHLIAQGTPAIYFVRLSPDDQYLATAGKDAVIRFYSSASWKLLFSIETHQIEVNGLAFSPDGGTLASAGDDGTIAIWQIDWKHLVARHRQSIKAHPFQAYNVLYARDGRTLISAGRDKVIRLWDAATGRSIGVLEGHGDTAGSIALHPAGKWVASAGHDGEVIVWDLASHAIVHRVSAGGAPLLAIDFSDDGRLLAGSTSEHEIRIWRVPSWELANKIDLLDHAQRIAFMPDGASIVACDYGGTVHMLPTGVETSGATIAHLASGLRAWKAHAEQIYSLAVLRKSRELITAGSDGSVIAWNLSPSADFQDIRVPQAEVEDIRFIPQSDQLALTDGSTISLWGCNPPAQSRVLGKVGANVRCLGASRDGALLVAGAMSGILRLYHLREGGRESEWRLAPNFNIHRVAVSPDGRLIAAIDRYNSEKHDDLYVVDAQSGKRLEPIRAAECNGAAFSPDGQWLFATGPANVVTVWNVRTRQKVSELPGHTSSINWIVFHPQSEWVATASDDRLIKIWSTTDWRFRFNLEGAHGPVVGLATSPNGRTLASSERDGVLTLWHTAIEDDLFQPLFDIDFSPAHPERVTFSSDGRLLACVLNDPTSSSAKRFVRVLKWRSETHSTAAE